MKCVRSAVAAGVAMIAGVAGCDTPVPALHLGLSGASSQQCPSTDCRAVPLDCPAVMSIKIMDPGKPDQPYLTQCTPIARNSSSDMCALYSVDLVSKPIPVRDLVVQIALYPATSIATDPTDQSLLCPDNVDFALGTGFPVEQASSMSLTPALGGTGYYHPGDAVVDVDLGCTDLRAINEACMPANLFDIDATVLDFSTGSPVESGSSGVGQLQVFVGEPHSMNGQYSLSTDDLQPLKRQSGDGDAAAAWGGSLTLDLTKYACLQVLEGVAQSTATVTCRPVTASPLELRGVWIQKKQLDSIVAALGAAGFPDDGITIGMVVDASGRPRANATVTAKGATVLYLSPDMQDLVTDKTGSSGIFVSTTAEFGTEFSASQGSGEPTLIGIGGKIANRATVVILSPNGTR